MCSPDAPVAPPVSQPAPEPKVAIKTDERQLLETQIADKQTVIAGLKTSLAAAPGPVKARFQKEIDQASIQLAELQNKLSLIA